MGLVIPVYGRCIFSIVFLVARMLSSVLISDGIQLPTFFLWAHLGDAVWKGTFLASCLSVMPLHKDVGISPIGYSPCSAVYR